MWGVAIILLTLLVKALLFPLNRIQQSSMARYSAVMGKLKPEIDALKEKYKNNKQKFNQEQMKLLKEHGATPPLGGCLLIVSAVTGVDYWRLARAVMPFVIVELLVLGLLIFVPEISLAIPRAMGLGGG